MKVQIEADITNWRIKNKHWNKWNVLADCLYRINMRGGGIGAMITNISMIDIGVNNDDVNKGMEIEQE